MRVCGGTTVPVSPASINAQLQSGAIAAAAADINNVAERELWRVADTIINLRHAPSLFTVFINEQAWQALSPAERQIVSEVAEDTQDVRARFARIRADAFAGAVQKGLRIVEPSADDIVQWRACSAALLEEYMVSAGDRPDGSYSRPTANFARNAAAATHPVEKSTLATGDPSSCGDAALAKGWRSMPRLQRAWVAWSADGHLAKCTVGCQLAYALATAHGSVIGTLLRDYRPAGLPCSER